MKASSLTQLLRDRVRLDFEGEMDTPTKRAADPDVLLSPTSVEIQRAEAELVKITKKNTLLRLKERLRSEQEATEQIEEVIGGMSLHFFSLVVCVCAKSTLLRGRDSFVAWFFCFFSPSSFVFVSIVLVFCLFRIRLHVTTPTRTSSGCVSLKGDSKSYICY